MSESIEPTPEVVEVKPGDVINLPPGQYTTHLDEEECLLLLNSLERYANSLHKDGKTDTDLFRLFHKSQDSYINARRFYPDYLKPTANFL